MREPREAPDIKSFSFNHPKHALKSKKLLVALEIIAGIIAIALICSLSPQDIVANSAVAQASDANPSTAKVSEIELIDVPDQVAVKEACSHSWVPITTTIKHPRISHEVIHDAEYETKTELHTICNECSQIIDGVAQDHIDETDHSGFTTSIPIHEKILLKDAWVENVVDEEAWVETLTEGYVCSSCNETATLLA